MAKRYQILVIEEGEDRWRFLAHGATFEPAEANAWVATHSKPNRRFRVLPVPKMPKAKG